MQTEMILISYWDLAILSLLVMLMGIVLWLHGFSHVGQYYWANIRTVAQLSLMGVWLSWVFNADNPLWVALVGLIMLLAAGYEIAKRQQYRFARYRSVLSPWDTAPKSR
ncbi:hypothetical protein THMIRHAS_23470 [Thiosulfatimonas sediminis]|uniref:Uncharacterized protein n=1 Tax=Thiosulfatimonas sediminis TaxID=2675054 RepID=A0A6F8PYA2_9GAMM|nr:ABC transporter permease [Thiosulfatimonas sediminis]BBP46974.1 hypothetical protein THMIRHAS_23470 [Thiosulfatimonas sediminis]